jgi:hypothetical protein
LEWKHKSPDVSRRFRSSNRLCNYLSGSRNKNTQKDY